MNPTQLDTAAVDKINTGITDINAKTGSGIPVLTVGGLTSNPNPIDIPPVKPLTQAPALSGALTSTTDAFTKSLNDAADAAKGAKNDSLDALIASLTATPGKTALTDTAYRTNGVDTTQTNLQQTTDQINAERRALDDKIKAIKANPEGYFGTGMRQEIDKVTNESLSKQADLAVIQLARQGAYDSAKAIADRAVAAKFEADQTRNDTLKFIYEQNKADFTDAEQKAFTVAQADRERTLNLAKDKELARYQQMLKDNSAGGTTLNGKPQTSLQSQIQGYAERTTQSDKIIANVGANFTGATSALGEYLPNFLKSSDRQQYEQAQRDFVNAVLRRESGAAINASEFDSARQQYFPQPGDSPEVVAQKAANRATVIANLYQQANVAMPVSAGDTIEGADGTRYKVGEDGQTLTPVNQ